MKYSEIENKYIKANIKGHYKFQNASEIEAVLGYDIRTIRGFNDLTDEDKKLAERLICGFINGHGLEAREEIRPTGIERKLRLRAFKVTFKNKNFSYLYDCGTVG